MFSDSNIVKQYSRMFADLVKIKQEIVLAT